jgi:hypothetical protein
MSVNPSSDPNTETECHNPVSSDLEDMRGLLVCLETLHTENPVSIPRLDFPVEIAQLWTLNIDSTLQTEMTGVSRGFIITTKQIEKIIFSNKANTKIY